MKKLSLITLTLIGSMLFAAACGDKKDKDKGAADEGASDKAQPAEKKAPPKAAAAEMAAPDFFKDYNSLQGMEVMDKYGKGVTVHGTVLRTIEEMDGSIAVWLDAGDGNWVSLKFADKGEAAKGKGVKKDDTVKAQCQVGGASDKYVMNIDCKLL
jgi:hypothetical protein